MDSTQFGPRIEPDSVVQGRRVPDELASCVSRGWHSGVGYALLLLLSLIYATPEAESDLLLLLGAFDLLLVLLLVWGVRRWHLISAWLLSVHPIQSTLVLVAMIPLGTGPSGQIGALRILYLVVFLYTFGRAALAIQRFQRSGS